MKETRTPAAAPVFIDGHGTTARITALALAAAGLPVALHAPTRPSADKSLQWQRVLALSPSSRRMLEVLHIWDGLSLETAPIMDMRVQGGDAAGLAAQLGFAETAEAEDDIVDATPLGWIVSLSDLAHATDATLAASSDVILLPAPIDAFDADSGALHLADGTAHQAGLMVDTKNALLPDPPAWQLAQNRRAVRHDYQASALVACLASSLPHGQMAQQLFLRDGPLALLPLPAPDRLALVWTLPTARAEALHLAANQSPAILTHELAKATQGRFGALTLDGSAACLPLTLFLAEPFIETDKGVATVLVGEAAHVIHPLAGQGFNLSLRDAAQLAETLYETRRLGLAFSDAACLAGYATPRQAAARQMAAATHGLARLFGSSGTLGQGLATTGQIGLQATQRLAERTPKLRQNLRRAADGADTPMPRLMHGETY